MNSVARELPSIVLSSGPYALERPRYHEALGGARGASGEVAASRDELEGQRWQTLGAPRAGQTRCRPDACPGALAG